MFFVPSANPPGLKAQCSAAVTQHQHLTTSISIADTEVRRLEASVEDMSLIIAMLRSENAETLAAGARALTGGVPVTTGTDAPTPSESAGATAASQGHLHAFMGCDDRRDVRVGSAGGVVMATAPRAHHALSGDVSARRHTDDAATGLPPAPSRSIVDDAAAPSYDVCEHEWLVREAAQATLARSLAGDGNLKRKATRTTSKKRGAPPGGQRVAVGDLDAGGGGCDASASECSGTAAAAAPRGMIRPLVPARCNGGNANVGSSVGDDKRRRSGGGDVAPSGFTVS